MDYNDINVFIKVVQAGSFVKAGQQLNMPKSTVSFKVAALERHLGTTLIQRTTRKLSVTPAGDVFFKKCMKGFAELHSAETEALQNKQEPQGLLRVTAPVELGNTVLPMLVAEYTTRYPKVSIELIVTDRNVDLIGENIDLAIRGGALKDSTMIAKKLGSGFFAMYASPKYLKNKTEPKHPKDLIQHQCVQFTAIGLESWPLTNTKGQTLKATVPGRIIANDLNVVKAIALRGEGIALLLTENCQTELRSGKLVRVLPEWRSHLTALHLVYPAQQFVTAKLKAFMELANEVFKKKFDELEF